MSNRLLQQRLTLYLVLASGKDLNQIEDISCIEIPHVLIIPDKQNRHELLEDLVKESLWWYCGKLCKNRALKNQVRFI